MTFAGSQVTPVGRDEVVKSILEQAMGGERTMLRAIWNGAVLAESDDIVMVEGNAYFPRESLDEQYLEESGHHSLCPWKGIASYFHVVAFGEKNENAAWYYPHPSLLVRKIKNRVAFWNGVQIQETDRGDVREEAPASAHAN